MYLTPECTIGFAQSYVDPKFLWKNEGKYGSLDKEFYFRYMSSDVVVAMWAYIVDRLSVPC